MIVDGDRGQKFSLARDRDAGGEVRTQPMGIRRKTQSHRPIRPQVKTVGLQNDGNVVFGQPRNPSDERRRAAQAVVVRVEAVSGNQDAMHVARQGLVDDLLEGQQRGVLDGFSISGREPGGHRRWQPMQLVIEQQSCGMNATKRVHRSLRGPSLSNGLPQAAKVYPG